MKSYFLSLSIFFCISASLAQVTLDSFVINIDTVIYFEKKTFDLMYQPTWFAEDSLVRASIYKQKGEIKEFTEQEIKEKMNLIPTTFPLNYNHVVKQTIEQFAENRRLLMSQSMGIGRYYFPMFEEILSKHQVPLVFKYLPIIESNLNPFARSGAGAQGMWQFMIRTGKSYGLRVNDYYDERCDPILSTEAAASYLSDLYKIYDDWQLVLSAYNCGPGNVNKAIALAGGKTSYWEIRPYLPKETRDYVPRFIATIFVMTYADSYDLLATQPSQDLFITDTFLISEKVSIPYICELTGLDSLYMQFINPALKTSVVPSGEKPFALNIPYNYLGQFAALETFWKEDPYLLEIEAEVIEVEVPKYTVYKVKNGDTLGHIGMKYGVGVSKIKKWNSLKSDNLKIGQKLILYI